MPELVELADSYKTDKGTQIGHAHNYATLYSFLFEQFRDQAFSMLEIGLERGGVEAGASVDRVGSDVPSIRMWLDIPFAHTDYLSMIASQIQNVYVHRNNRGSINDWHFKMVALQKRL